MHRAFGHLAAELCDVVRPEAARGEAAGAVDIGMGHGAAGVRLEGQRLGHPALAEAVDELAVIARGGVGEAVEEPVRALEHAQRPGEAGARQQRRGEPGLRRPAGMEPLRPGAVGEIFDDAAGHAAGDAERVDGLVGREAERAYVASLIAAFRATAPR